MESGSREPASVNGVLRPPEWGRRVRGPHARHGVTAQESLVPCLAGCPKKGWPPARRRRVLGVGRAGRGSGTVKPAWSRWPAPDSMAPGQPHTWRCCCAPGRPPRALAGDTPAGETGNRDPGGGACLGTKSEGTPLPPKGPPLGPPEACCPQGWAGSLSPGPGGGGVVLTKNSSRDLGRQRADREEAVSWPPRSAGARPLTPSYGQLAAAVAQPVPRL